jgi:hypothetical protein
LPFELEDVDSDDPAERVRLRRERLVGDVGVGSAVVAEVDAIESSGEENEQEDDEDDMGDVVGDADACQGCHASICIVGGGEQEKDEDADDDDAESLPGVKPRPEPVAAAA